MDQNEYHGGDGAYEKDNSGYPQQGDDPTYNYNPSDEPQGTYPDGTYPGGYDRANNYPDPVEKSEATTTANEYGPDYDSEGSYYGTDYKGQD
ncbi:MAG TPA: hypothetical protein VJ183_10705 [Chloroflexia bacterium]|nr:hypothetical protein [Chloroflexia bacterium]